MNMQSLMAEANKMQRELKRINEEIENTTYEGTSSAVKVEMSGKCEIINVNIIDEEILREKELLEDMIQLAVNDALRKLNAEKQAKLGKYTGGLGGLF